MISIILPLLISVSMSLAQMIVGFIHTPVLSFALICIYYIVDVYYTSLLFIGNYTMWLRSSYVDENGLNPDGGFVLATAIITIVIISARRLFTKYEII